MYPIKVSVYGSYISGIGGGELKEAVTSVEPVVVYQLSDLRYVYGCEITYLDDNIFDSLTHAKDRAEKVRETGRFFNIEPKPALHFMGKHHGLLVVDFTTDFTTGSPFFYVDFGMANIKKNINETCRSSVKFDKIIEQLDYTDQEVLGVSYIKYRYGNIKEACFDKLKADKVKGLRSHTQGGGYNLGWRDVHKEIDATSTINSAKKLQKIISAIATKN